MCQPSSSGDFSEQMHHQRSHCREKEVYPRLSKASCYAVRAAGARKEEPMYTDGEDRRIPLQQFQALLSVPHKEQLRGQQHLQLHRGRE